MLIDYEIFKWLVDSKVLIQTEKPIVRSDNKVELDEKSANMIQNGLIFAKLIRALKRLAQSLSKTPIQTPPNLKQLKEANNSSARVYNWNIIVEALAKLNYRIDNDIKSLIIAGDEDMVLEVLKEVYRFIMKFGKIGVKEKPITAASSVASSDVIERLHNRYPVQKTLAESVTSGPTYSKQNTTSYKALHGKPEAVDLHHVNVDTPLENTGGLMELLVVSLSKALSLSSKQSMALLANGNKYLAHVVAKGIKGNFEPVSAWYQALFSQSKQLLQLVIKEESTGSVNTLLQALKPGLYSKSEDVAQWTCRLLSKLGADFATVNLLPATWEWFTGTAGGLFAFLACLKRQSDISSVIVSAIIQFGRYNLLEMFTVEMRKIFVEPLEYIQNILLLLKPLTETKLTRDELLTSSIVDFFINLGLKHSDSADRSASPELRSAALALLCDLWEIYPSKIEQQEGLANQVLLAAKKGIRDNFNSLKIVSVTYLFRLLEIFASERNPYAPIVYKILTFSLIEHHEDQVLREHLILNFVQIFRNFTSIPVAVLLEPLVKQIQVSEGTTYQLNLFDFKLIDTLASHPKLSLKQGIMLLDVLAKTYLNNVTFSPLAGPPFLKVANKFMEDEAMEEYLLEFGKLALSKYFSSVKKRKVKDNSIKKFVYKGDKDDFFSGPTNLTSDMEQEIMSAQRRALIINMIRDIIKFHSGLLNAKYKTLLLYTNTQIKQITRHDNKGIKFLLSMLGDPNELIKDYEEEMQRMNEEKKVSESQQNPLPLSSEYSGFKDISRASTKALPKKVLSPKAKGKSPDAKSRGRKVSPNENFEDVSRSGDAKTEISEIKMSKKGSPVNKTGVEIRKSGSLAGDDWDQVNVEGPLDITNLKSISMTEDHLEGKAESVVSKIERRSNRGKAKEIAEAKKKDKEAQDALRFMKAIEELEGIKKKKNDEKMTKEMMEEYKKLKDEKTKELLKKKIDQRRMELGVHAKTNNQMITEDDHDMRPSAAPKKKGREGRDIEGMMIVEFDEEESYQKETVTIYIKQNIKKFKYLFNKYCLTGAAYQKEKSFDKLRVQYNTINQVALLRMVKDNGLHTSISKEEVTQLLKLVNTKLLGNQDFEPLNLEGFIKFTVQLGIYINTRPPLDQAHPNYADCVKKMMFEIYLAAQARGEHKLMLEEGTLPGDVDRHELEMLNKQIQEDPNMTLPPKYRRVMENNVDYEFNFPTKLQVPQKFKIAYQILDDILHKQFGFHIIESKALFSTHMKVVPQARVEVVAPGKGKPPRAEQDEIIEHRESRGRSTDPEKRNTEGSRSNRDISADRPIAKPEGKIVNKVMEEKLRKAEEEKKKQEELDKKIKQRKMELEARMKEMAEQKKEKDLKKEEEKRTELKQKEEQEKQKEEARKKELEKKKQLLYSYKEKKEQESKQAEELEKEKNIKKAEQKKEQAANLKKQTENVQKQFEDKKKKREEEEKLRLQKLEEDKKKEELNKKKVELKIEKEREKREKEKEVSNQLIKLHESASIQEFYNQNVKRLNVVFKHYKESPERDIMTFKEFMTMGAQLNLFPSLISSEEFKLIFRSLTRDKTGELGLTYNDFLQSLTRVAVKSQSILNRIAEKFFAGGKLSGDAGKENVRDIMNKARQAIGQGSISQEEEKEAQGEENYERNTVEKETIDEYHDIADLRKETLEGLLIYLDLPIDHNKLIDKLNSLRIENQKTAAPRDKKRVAIQSVGGAAQQRSISPNTREPVQRGASNKQLNKPGGGAGKPPVAGQKKVHGNLSIETEELAGVELEDLSSNYRGQASDNDSPNGRDAMIIAPGGEKETWGIKNANKKKDFEM